MAAVVPADRGAYTAKKKEEAKSDPKGKKNKRTEKADDAKQGAAKRQKKAGDADVKADETKAKAADGAADSKDGGGGGGAAAAGDAADTPMAPVKREYVKDLLVSFANLPPETMREDLKESCAAVGGKVRYIDYSKGQTSGIVRLDDTTEVKATEVAKQLIEKGLEIKNIKPTLIALAGAHSTAQQSLCNPSV
jgi:hypothetical protein